MIVPDTLLLAQLKQGDEDAFENLFRRHYDRVYRVLLNLLGSHDEAEDLLQETFLALYCQPPTIEHQAELVAWLCRVALNRGYNALRGKRRALQRAQKVSPSSITMQEDPHETVVRNQERERVRNTLATLAPRKSRLPLLRHTGYSYSEIATILNVASSSIGTLLVRAERAFLQQYQEIALQQCESTRLLRAYLDEALPIAQVTRLTTHLLTCAECRHLLEDLRQLRAQVSARFVVQQPHQEVLNQMVNTLLEQARELRLSGQWQELAQLEQEISPQGDVTTIERAEFYALAANAHLHLGDKDSAERLLLKLEEEPNMFPAEHKLRNEVQALKAELDETTPEGQMWWERHTFSLNGLDGNAGRKRMEEIAEQILVSPMASVEQRCEVGYFLFTSSWTRGQYDQSQHYLQQLEADLQLLPGKHHMHTRMKQFKDRQLQYEKRMRMMHFIENRQYEQALVEAEQFLRMETTTVQDRYSIYTDMILVYRDQGNAIAVERCLTKLKQEAQQLPEESPLREHFQDFCQRLANQPPSLVARLLWRGQELMKEDSWAELVELIKPILELEGITKQERRKAYAQLAQAYKNLKQEEECQRFRVLLEEEMKGLPVPRIVRHVAPGVPVDLDRLFMPDDIIVTIRKDGSSVIFKIDSLGKNLR